MSSYLMRPPRHFSNKENTSYAPSSPIASLLNPMNASSSTPGRAPSSVGSSSTAAASAAIRSHKHRLGGIGKAPRRIKTASKPYDRCASVTRAKKRAANAVGGPKGSKSAPASVCPGVEVTPPVPDFPLDPRLADPAPATATATAPAAPAAPVVRMAEIPLRLPRPTISLVTELTGEWAGVPPVYALHRLTPFFQSILMTGAQYHPLASTSNDPLYVPFGFMKILQGDVELGRRIRGREPDVVLAIHDKNDPARPAKLVPVQSAVYGPQCAAWPAILAERAARVARYTQPAAASSSASTSSSTSTPSGSAPKFESDTAVKLEPISEGDEDVGMTSLSSITSTTPDVPGAIAESTAAAFGYATSAAGPSTLAPIPSPTSSTSPTSSSDPNTNTNTNPYLAENIPINTPGYLRLPIHTFTLPHPDSFSHLHIHLHMPSTPLLPVLLDLPPFIHSAESPALAPIMREMPKVELMKKMEFVRGFWSNVCAMGVGADRTWAAMGEAWGVCVDELKRRAREREAR